MKNTSTHSFIRISAAAQRLKQVKYCESVSNIIADIKLKFQFFPGTLCRIGSFVDIDRKFLISISSHFEPFLFRHNIEGGDEMRNKLYREKEIHFSTNIFHKYLSRTLLLLIPEKDMFLCHSQ